MWEVQGAKEVRGGQEEELAWFTRRKAAAPDDCADKDQQGGQEGSRKVEEYGGLRGGVEIHPLSLYRHIQATLNVGLIK